MPEDHDLSPRADLAADAPASYRAMVALDAAAKASLPADLVELVKLRASLLNGCAFCIDLHSRAARELGMDEERIIAVAAWRESPRFDPTERAALGLTDAITDLDGGVPDQAWDDAVAALGEATTLDLVYVAATINAWNRLALATRTGGA